MEIGDIVKILDIASPNKNYDLCTIIDICKKKGYNMYVCKSLKTKSRKTFTDMDLNLRYRGKGKMVELLW